MRWNWVIVVCLLLFPLGCQKEPEPTYQGRQVSYWIMNLTSSSEEDQEEAARALVAIGEPAVSPLIKVLKEDKDIELRSSVVSVLAEMGHDAKAARGVLLKLARDAATDPELRGLCLKGFIRAEPDSDEVLATVTDMLEHGNRWGRRCGARGLQWMGAKAKDAAPALARAVVDGEDTLSVIAADVLKEMGPAAKGAVPILMQGLSDKTGDITRRALSALEAIGVEGDDAVKMFLSMLEDADPGVRQAAVENLGAMGPAAKAAVPALVKALEDEKYYVRWAAVRELGNIGPDAKSALPALERARETFPRDREALYEAARRQYIDVPEGAIYMGAAGIRVDIDRAIEKIGPKALEKSGSVTTEGTISYLEYQGNNYLWLSVSIANGDSIHVWCSGGRTEVYSGSSKVTWGDLVEGRKIRVQGEWTTQEGDTLLWARRIYLQ